MSNGMNLEEATFSTSGLWKDPVKSQDTLSLLEEAWIHLGQMHLSFIQSFSNRSDL